MIGRSFTRHASRAFEVKRLVLFSSLLVACSSGTVDGVDPFAAAVAVAEASGGEATCGGGGRWQVCFVLANGVLTVVPVDDNIINNSGVTVILMLEGVEGPVEIDLGSPPVDGIRWSGGFLDSQFVDRSGATTLDLGSVRSQFRGDQRN